MFDLRELFEQFRLWVSQQTVEVFVVSNAKVQYENIWCEFIAFRCRFAVSTTWYLSATSTRYQRCDTFGTGFSSTIFEKPTTHLVAYSHTLTHTPNTQKKRVIWCERTETKHRFTKHAPSIVFPHFHKNVAVHMWNRILAGYMKHQGAFVRVHSFFFFFFLSCFVCLFAEWRLRTTRSIFVAQTTLSFLLALGWLFICFSLKFNEYDAKRRRKNARARESSVFSVEHFDIVAKCLFTKHVSWFSFIIQPDPYTRMRCVESLLNVHFRVKCGIVPAVFFKMSQTLIRSFNQIHAVFKHLMW